MNIQFFRKHLLLHLFHEILQLILKTVFLLLLFIPLYSVAFVLTDNVLLLCILPAASFVFFVLLFIRENVSAKNIYLKINDLNSHLRNYYYTYYEMLLDDSHISRTGMENIRAALTDKGVKLFDVNRYSRLVLLISIALIINLIALIAIPQFYALAWGFAEKEAVISSVDGMLELYTFNMGHVNGRYMIRHDEKITDYSHYNGLNSNAWIFFQGPHVKSNELPLQNVRHIMPDSVVTYITPPAYTGTEPDIEYGSNITVPEFSSINVRVYYGNMEAQGIIEQLQITDTVISIHSDNGVHSVSLNIEPDQHPYIDVMYNINTFAEDIVKIPYLTFDDYGIRATGALIISGSDSQYIYSENTDDTIFIISFIRSPKRDYSVICFAEDNNPYRKQISYSEPIVIGHLSDLKRSIIAADSLNALSEQSDNVDEIIEKMEYERSSITETQKHPDIKSYNKTVEDIRKFTEEVSRSIEEISQYAADETLLKELYEIKEHMNNLDEELINSIFTETQYGEMSMNELREAREYIKNNSDKIIDQLQELKEMLSRLADMSMLMKTDARLEELIEKQDEVGSNTDIDQEDITEGLKDAADELNDYPSLADIKQSLQEASDMSLNAADEAEKRDDVKQSMQSIREQISDMMSSMNNMASPDTDMLLLSLGLINEQELNNSTRNSMANAYRNMRAYLLNNNASVQLAMLFENGEQLAYNAGAMDTIINYNLYIAASLLNMQKNQGQGKGMSMQQIMQSMQSMSRKQTAISQMLTEMLRQGESGQEMLNEMARMQKEMSSMMREMSQQSSGKLGGQLEALADSLEVLSEELKHGLNKELNERERNIMDRMLEFNRSVYKQGLSNERESETGERTQAEPAVKPAGANQYSEQWQYILETMNNVESLYYRTIIRRYFKEILKW